MKIPKNIGINFCTKKKKKKKKKKRDEFWGLGNIPSNYQKPKGTNL